MAAIDSTGTPFKWPGSGDITITDGSANSVTWTLVGSFSWTEPGRTAAEVMERRRHQGTPVILDLDDGVCEISFSGKITSFLGSANVHPYEALRQRGNASGWTKVGGGDRYTYQLTIVATHPDGSTQTLTFTPVSTGTLTCNMDGEEGQATIEGTLTAYMNEPTVA